ncbi:MAG: hypothetical protein INF52_01940 [Rhodobacter sp.]|nr:hypothetical protein [Rhodobacter sp.]
MVWATELLLWVQVIDTRGRGREEAMQASAIWQIWGPDPNKGQIGCGLWIVRDKRHDFGSATCGAHEMRKGLTGHAVHLAHPTRRTKTCNPDFRHFASSGLKCAATDMPCLVMKPCCQVCVERSIFASAGFPSCQWQQFQAVARSWR